MSQKLVNEVYNVEETVNGKTISLAVSIDCNDKIKLQQSDGSRYGSGSVSFSDADKDTIAAYAKALSEVAKLVDSRKVTSA